MCDTCGCGDSNLVPVEIHERLLAANDRAALHNRQHFAQYGVLAVNLMGSPGSGKTALLEATARARPRLRMAAMSGDLATDNDALRLRAAGIPARSITTGSACHLDADLVHRELEHLPLAGLDVLVIENVGNLVCPAIYDLGEHVNVVALAVTEGEDKPLKYPVMFREADLVVLTKTDLLPHLDVDLEAIEDALARTMPEPRMIAVSARTGQGIDQWLAWLDERRAAVVGGTPAIAPHARHGHEARDPHSAHDTVSVHDPRPHHQHHEHHHGVGPTAGHKHDLL